jgi:hypothetical protein
MKVEHSKLLGFELIVYSEASSEVTVLRKL